MNRLKKHIILIGFKHVGKSTVGMALAEKLQLPFIDLDQQIEKNYQDQSQQKLSCREIFNRDGESFFRECETQVLRQIIDHPTMIVALGGGTPLREENQRLIKPHWLIHITVSPQTAYARIMAHGKPAFFPAKQDPLEFFQQLWLQREKIYADLANFTVDNTQNVTQTLSIILKNLEKNR